MNNNPEISIIVPVYNCEKYLYRCLESIIEQSFGNWECLLVDDGSTDRSGKILDEYALRDKRLVVFHKTNGGVSSARNLGLDVAKGVFVVFMDSDDLWLSPSCLEEVKASVISTEADITRFDYKAIDENNNVLYRSCHIKYRERYSNQPITNDVFLSEIIRGEFFGPLLFIRRSIIGSLRFNENQKFLEDMDFIARLVPLANKCCYIPKQYYGYRKLKDSASNSGNYKNIEDSFNMCYAFHKYAANMDNQKLKESYDWYSIMMYVWTLKSISYDNFTVSRKEIFKIIDIEGIRRNILKWRKKYKGSKTLSILVLIPSKISSVLLVSKNQIIRSLNGRKR